MKPAKDMQMKAPPRSLRSLPPEGSSQWLGAARRH